MLYKNGKNKKSPLLSKDGILRVTTFIHSAGALPLKDRNLYRTVTCAIRRSLLGIPLEWSGKIPLGAKLREVFARRLLSAPLISRLLSVDMGRGYLFPSKPCFSILR